MEKNIKSVILIVDDTPANLFAIEKLLEADDRLLLTSSSGKDALQTTLNNTVDLIILDVQMPEMDGFEVAQILKSNKRTRDIPIIFATAVSKEHRFVMKGYEEGAVDYLYKPLNPEILKAKVAVLLKMQMQKRELIEKNAALEKSALLINNSADIIGIIDAETLRIEEINNAFTLIVNATAEEAKGKPLSSFLTSDSKELVHQLKDEKKEQLLFETGVYYKDNSIKWLQWKVIVKEGKWFVNARDITQIKEAHEQISEMNNYLEKRVEDKTKEVIENEKQYRFILEKRAEELMASNAELERFAFVASHDLQEPLRTISSFLSLLEAETKDQLTEDAQEYIKYAIDGAERLSILIHALLSYSRLDSIKEKISEVDCNRVVNVVLQVLESLIKQRKAVINLNPLPKVQGINQLLQQLFQNLIANAIKYNKNEIPVIEVGCSDAENLRKFYVKDNGIGIEEIYKDKIFIIFQRLHNKNEYSGTGIGLAICKKIVERHGGTIWIESEIDKGSTFYFTIPK